MSSPLIGYERSTSATCAAAAQPWLAWEEGESAARDVVVRVI